MMKEDSESFSLGRQLCWDRMVSLLEEHSSLVLSLIKNFPERHALLEGMTLPLVVRTIYRVSLIFSRRRMLYLGQGDPPIRNPLGELWLSLNCNGKVVRENCLGFRFSLVGLRDGQSGSLSLLKGSDKGPLARWSTRAGSAHRVQPYWFIGVESSFHLLGEGWKRQISRKIWYSSIIPQRQASTNIFSSIGSQ